MGNVAAISWVYQHPELHEDDFVSEYQSVAPYVGLNPSEILVEGRVKAQFEDRLERLVRQAQEYAS